MARNHRNDKGAHLREKQKFSFRRYYSRLEMES